MAKYLIVGNWKMNPSSKKEAVKLFESVKKGIRAVKNAEVVVCPPFVYLTLFKGLTLGAQNVFYKDEGAFTGEISPQQLSDLDVEYVILGHSEVRRELNETDEVINRKIKECLLAKLKLILCVGEASEENENGKKAQVLEKQVRGALEKVPSKEMKNITIAYEPIWAIGTGKNCSVDETMTSALLIRKIIARLYNMGLARNLRILYGGSVNSSNSAQYLESGGVNGLLVGGSSLDAGEFVKIVKSAG